MKRQILRLSMAIALVVITVVAATMWSSEYQTAPDPAARFEIQAVKITEDMGYFWLESHLKRSGDEPHDLAKPVRLITADGTEHQPADTTFAGNPEEGFTDIWYKFWLGKEELKGEIDLKINDGILKIKSSTPIPDLGGEKDTVFKSSEWRKSWLGF